MKWCFSNPTEGETQAYHCADFLLSIWRSDETFVVCWVEWFWVAFPGHRLGPPVIWKKRIPWRHAGQQKGWRFSPVRNLHFFKVMTTLPEVRHFWKSRVSSVRNWGEEQGNGSSKLCPVRSYKWVRVLCLFEQKPEASPTSVKVKQETRFRKPRHAA